MVLSFIALAQTSESNMVDGQNKIEVFEIEYFVSAEGYLLYRRTRAFGHHRRR